MLSILDYVCSPASGADQLVGLTVFRRSISPMRIYHIVAEKCRFVPTQNKDMPNDKKEDYSFWTKYKKFATNEILLYVVMILVIIIGLFFIL